MSEKDDTLESPKRRLTEERALKRMLKPVTCPICQKVVMVVAVPLPDGTLQYTATDKRPSSLKHCPRCNGGTEDE